MKILVTGAAGYVGSICAELLVKLGHTVIALDNLSEGHRQESPRKRFSWMATSGIRYSWIGFFAPTQSMR